jgi:hypothetical protein
MTELDQRLGGGKRGQKKWGRDQIAGARAFASGAWGSAPEFNYEELEIALAEALAAAELALEGEMASQAEVVVDTERAEAAPAFDFTTLRIVDVDSPEVQVGGLEIEELESAPVGAPVVQVEAEVKVVAKP